MGDDKSTSGPEQEAEVTQETIEALATKLDAFGEGLSVEERVVLGALLNAGMQAVSSEAPTHAPICARGHASRNSQDLLDELSA